MSTLHGVIIPQDPNERQGTTLVLKNLPDESIPPEQRLPQDVRTGQIVIEGPPRP